MASIINATTTNGVVASGDNSGSLQLATNNGTTAVTIDTSQNIGVGTTTPTGKFEVRSANNTGTDSIIRATSNNGTASTWLTFNGVSVSSGNACVFYNGTTEQMRVGADGVVMVNTTTSGGSTPGQSIVYYNAGQRWGMFINDTTSTNGAYPIGFGSGGNLVGRVQSTSSSVSYVTSSDYRLKENIAPMAGALAKVQQLKPCTFTWKIDNKPSQGFIAHELQAVVPEAVNGEKDALNEDGSINPQGVDTSFLVATLTAAIQELNAKVDAQAVRIAELEGAK